MRCKKKNTTHRSCSIQNCLLYYHRSNCKCKHNRRSFVQFIKYTWFFLFCFFFFLFHFYFFPDENLFKCLEIFGRETRFHMISLKTRKLSDTFNHDIKKSSLHILQISYPLIVSIELNNIMS